jgi:hypothetical protein
VGREQTSFFLLWRRCRRRCRWWCRAGGLDRRFFGSLAGGYTGASTRGSAGGDGLFDHGGGTAVLRVKLIVVRLREV